VQHHISYPAIHEHMAIADYVAVVVSFVPLNRVTNVSFQFSGAYCRILMRKIKLFIASSLDGYIARQDGSIDWLFTDAGIRP
jgi:hypothetical protein